MALLAMTSLMLTSSALAAGPPEVTITSEGGLISGTYQLTAQVTGDVATGQVYFGVDDEDPDAVMTDAGNGSYQADIDVESLTEGPHTIYVKAVNATGTSTVASLDVDVDRNSPQVELTSAVGLVSGEVLITADVNDPYLNESAVILVVDDDLEASRDNILTRVDDHFGITLDTTTLPDGYHEVRVWAYDLWGSYNKSVGAGMDIDNTFPDIQITSDGGTYSGSYTLTIIVTDIHLNWSTVMATVGDDGPVLMDGDGGDRSLVIDLTAYDNEDLPITVEASDSLGSTSSEELTITVDNRPDLTVSYVDWGQTKLKVGDTLSVNVTVTNKGNVAASGFDVALLKDDQVLVEKPVSAPLGPDDSASYVVEWKVEWKGSIDIRVAVDPDDAVEEFNEDDNIYSETQTLKVANEGQDDSPGPAAIAAILTLAVAGYAMRRDRV